MKGILDVLNDFGTSTYLVLFGGFIMAYVVFQMLDLSSNAVFGYIVALAPIWLPYVTFILFFDEWLYYVKKKFDLNQGRVTIEIRLPQEIMKSPEAMEVVLSSMYQKGSPDNHVQTYVDGKHSPVYGLEIVSRGGDVKFYISVPRKKYKNLFESQLYAQYPGIEVHELPIDYTAEIKWEPENMFYFSLHFKLGEANCYPLKTYRDYMLHMNPKEEEKTDPITSILDTLATLGPDEHIWVQFVSTAHQKRNFMNGNLRAQGDWTDDCKAEIEKIMEKARDRTPEGMMVNLTEGERSKIDSIERNMAKYAFETNIRIMYFAKTPNPNISERLTPQASLFRQFDDVNRNKISICWRTDTNWPWWQDIGGKNSTKWKKEELYDYKMRTMDRKRYEGDNTSILSAEELATLFHLPGQVALTPTLGRIPSTRSEAPTNLPTE